MRTLLPEGVFPIPDSNGIDNYLKWDDWRVLGLLSQASAGGHGERLLNREFFREVWDTPEFPSTADKSFLLEVEAALAGFSPVKREAIKSWYKVGQTDIQIVDRKGTTPLSECSTIVARLQPSERTRIYVDKVRRLEAKAAINKLRSVS